MDRSSGDPCNPDFLRVTLHGVSLRMIVERMACRPALVVAQVTEASVSARHSGSGHEGALTIRVVRFGGHADDVALNQINGRKRRCGPSGRIHKSGGGHPAARKPSIIISY